LPTVVVSHTGDMGLLCAVTFSIEAQKDLVSYPSCVPKMWA